jgi:hypothetical protein
VKTLFDDDATLVHGAVDIADSLVPPPDYGVYAIRWPYLSLDAQGRLKGIRLILWNCMDRRVIRPLYDQVRNWGYPSAEILLLSMAGGPLQTRPERLEILQNVFTRLETCLPHLQKIWIVAHTGTCSGLKHFCGGRDVADALRPEFKAQALTKGIDPELYAAQLSVPSVSRLLPDSWRRFADFAVAEPVEESRSARLYSQWITADEAKSTAALFS